MSLSEENALDMECVYHIKVPSVSQLRWCAARVSELVSVGGGGHIGPGRVY